MKWFNYILLIYIYISIWDFFSFWKLLLPTLGVFFFGHFLNRFWHISNIRSSLQFGLFEKAFLFFLEGGMVINNKGIIVWLLYIYIFRFENVLYCFQVYCMYYVISRDKVIKVGEVSCNICISLIQLHIHFHFLESVLEMK